MARARDVTEAELAVLQVLWELEGATVREITDRIYPADSDGSAGNSEFATVQKLCERLEGKELVAADRSGRPKRYRATVDRASLTERKLQAVADDLHQGSVTPLVSQLLRGGKFSPDEIETLRSEVEQLASRRERKGASAKRTGKSAKKRGRGGSR